MVETGRCVVGAWLVGLAPDKREELIREAESDDVTRVAWLKMASAQSGAAPFSLTASKDHFLNNCACSRGGTVRSGTVATVETVGDSYTVNTFEPKSVDDVLTYCKIDTSKYELAGDLTVRSRELQNGDTVYAYSFKVRESTKPVDVEWLAERAKRANACSPESDPTAWWFVFQASDLQLGKRSSDGSTNEILERYWESVESALEQLRHSGPVAGIQLSFPGDCIEGSSSQGGRNVWLTQETLTEQTRIFRRLLMVTIERFAPFAGKVFVDVCNGNHDEQERRWNTYPGDGWATECAISVRDALKLNEAAYGHVEVRVPHKWSGSMTVPVGDTMVTVAHGHQWRRGQGMKWWSEQAINNQPAKDAQVLQHGHIHTWELEASRDRLRISSSTFDCGSDWFREQHGGEARRGALTYFMRAGDVRGMSLV